MRGIKTTFLGSVNAPGHVILTPMVSLLLEDLLLGLAILGWDLFLGLFLLLILLVVCVLLVLDLLLVTLAAGRLIVVVAFSFLLLLPCKVGCKLKLALEVNNHCNEPFLVERLCAPHVHGLEVGVVGSCFGHQVLGSEIGSRILIVVVVLLLLNILILEVVVANRKVGAKQLGNGIVDGGSACQDLCVVDVKVGVDEVNVSFDGGGIDG